MHDPLPSDLVGQFRSNSAAAGRASSHSRALLPTTNPFRLGRLSEIHRVSLADVTDALVLDDASAAIKALQSQIQALRETQPRVAAELLWETALLQIELQQPASAWQSCQSATGLWCRSAADEIHIAPFELRHWAVMASCAISLEDRTTFHQALAQIRHAGALTASRVNRSSGGLLRAADQQLMQAAEAALSGQTGAELQYLRLSAQSCVTAGDTEAAMPGLQRQAWILADAGRLREAVSCAEQCWRLATAEWRRSRTPRTWRRLTAAEQSLQQTLQRRKQNEAIRWN